MIRAIFDYAVRLGLMLSNPAKAIKRRTITQARIAVPSGPQFRRILAAIRQSGGRADSQAKPKPGADFVELLAYSRCRLHEAASLRWRDVDFDAGALMSSDSALAELLNNTLETIAAPPGRIYDKHSLAATPS